MAEKYWRSYSWNFRLMVLAFILCRYPYMAVVLNFSQSWALYCLIQFYTVTKDELVHIKPLAKFLMFKSIVFLTWWQGVGIALLSAFDLFRSPVAQGLQFKSSVQDFIICIEVAVSSSCIFPPPPTVSDLIYECWHHWLSNFCQTWLIISTRFQKSHYPLMWFPFFFPFVLLFLDG